ncbi:response regulator [Deinococcus sp. QL22]|uniref:response regulator n=1 Tax=Deinococcus sp. QL22 TaxID=2939437 RepID=UPI002016C304|nr:response regulator [Deinococcus sp. QL22]UQN10128.1 response regulator [Deinococcus sp. QL22]
MTRLLRIAVIDDNRSELFLLEEVFKTFAAQVKVTTYSDGKAAFDAMQHSDALCPDVVLLDINMPGMNGFEVLKAMKADAKLKCIPVVVLTTSMDESDVMQAYALFASAYLVKSGHFSDLLKQMKSLVEFWTRTRLMSWPSPSALDILQEVPLSR